MQDPSPTLPVVVGIDGSRAALHAARWAAIEAASRDTPLRLVHVVDVDHGTGEDPAVIARDWPDTRRGLQALRAASAAVRADGLPSVLETQIRYGNVDATLIDESDRAAMMCIGSVGIAPGSHQPIGSTAATVADRAHCPVAVIRRPGVGPDSSPPKPQWIVAVVDDVSAGDPIVESAVAEAHLRHAHVLVLGTAGHGRRPVHYDELERQVPHWRAAHPDVHVYPVSIPSSPARFLESHDELVVQLAVVGGEAAAEAPALIGPHRSSHPGRTQRSVLVVR